MPESSITAIADNVNPAASQGFAYDPADRLTNATGAYGNLAYTYDANSNRSSRTDGSGTANYTYAANSNVLTQAGMVSYTRDAAGNRLGAGYNVYTYAANNRMVSVSGATSAAYVHNGRGERTSKTAGGAATYYVYDLSGSLIGEYDGSGAVIREHAYGPAGRLASFDSTGNTYWHHNDHLGTPQAMTDGAGAVVWTMSQTPFGIATVDEDPDGNGTAVTNNFRFPGQYFDAETGLNYNYFRTYDPTLGRYTQHDPIGLDGGMNPFGYVGGNPVSNVDQMGLRPLSICEKTKLRPYIPQVDLDNADLHDGEVPWYLGKGFIGITRGNDIYFRPSVYDSRSSQGIALLGHELVHVGQYRNGMTWISYLWSIRNGYLNSKYEIPAYDLQRRILRDLANNSDCGCS